MLKTVARRLLPSRRPGMVGKRQLEHDAEDGGAANDASERPRGPMKLKRRTKHTDPDNPPVYSASYRARPHLFIRDLAGFHIPERLKQLPHSASKPKPNRKRNVGILALDKYIVSYTEYEVDRQLRSGPPDLVSPRIYKETKGFVGPVWRSKPWHNLAEQTISHEVEKEIRKYIRRYTNQHGSPPAWPQITELQPNVESGSPQKSSSHPRAALQSRLHNPDDPPLAVQEVGVSNSPAAPGSLRSPSHDPAPSRPKAPLSAALQSTSPQQTPSSPASRRDQRLPVALGPAIVQPASPDPASASSHSPAAPAPVDVPRPSKPPIKFSELSPNQREHLVTALSQRIEENVTQHALEILQGLDEHSPSGLWGAGIDDLVEKAVSGNHVSSPT